MLPAVASPLLGRPGNAGNDGNLGSLRHSLAFTVDFLPICGMVVIVVDDDDKDGL